MENSKKRVTTTRAMGWSTDTEKTEARWMPAAYTKGIYEVWHEGYCVAHVTDKWMTDLILVSLAHKDGKKQGRTTNGK